MELNSDALVSLNAINYGSILQWNIYNLQYWRNGYWSHADRLTSPIREEAGGRIHPPSDMILLMKYTSPISFRNVAVCMNKYEGKHPIQVQMFASNGKLIWTSHPERVAWDSYSDQKDILHYDIGMPLPELLNRIRPDDKNQVSRLMVRAVYPIGFDLIELNSYLGVLEYSHEGASTFPPHLDEWQTILSCSLLHLERRFHTVRGTRQTEFKLMSFHDPPCAVFRDIGFLPEPATVDQTNQSQNGGASHNGSNQPPQWSGEIEHLFRDSSPLTWSCEKHPSLIDLKLKLVTDEVFNTYRILTQKGEFAMLTTSDNEWQLIYDIAHEPFVLC